MNTSLIKGHVVTHRDSGPDPSYYCRVSTGHSFQNDQQVTTPAYIISTLYNAKKAFGMRLVLDLLIVVEGERLDASESGFVVLD